MGICSSSEAAIPPVPEAPITLEQLAGLRLEPLGSGASRGEKVAASSLWEDTGAIVMVIRRAGCMMCRAEAKQLAELHNELREAGSSIRLVGIVHEAYSVKGFVSYFKGGQLFMDVDKNFYKAMGDRWLGILEGVRLPGVKANVQRARAEGIEGNSKGEGRLLGGTLVIGKGDAGVIYTHHERVWGDRAPIEELREACAALDVPPK